MKKFSLDLGPVLQRLPLALLCALCPLGHAAPAAETRGCADNIIAKADTQLPAPLSTPSTPSTQPPGLPLAGAGLAGMSRIDAVSMATCPIGVGESQDAETVLVDVREARQFAQLSAIGSLNLPLWTLEHRTFLKDKSLLLIDDGKSPGQLVSACANLRAAGFNRVHALTGGLRVLHAAGKPLLGDAAAIERLYRISPEDLESQLGRPGWRTVTLNVPGNAAMPDGLASQEPITTADPKEAAARLRGRQPGCGDAGRRRGARGDGATWRCRRPARAVSGGRVARLRPVRAPASQGDGQRK